MLHQIALGVAGEGTEEATEWLLSCMNSFVPHHEMNSGKILLKLFMLNSNVPHPTTTVKMKCPFLFLRRLFLHPHLRVTFLYKQKACIEDFLFHEKIT